MSNAACVVIQTRANMLHDNALPAILSSRTSPQGLAQGTVKELPAPWGSRKWSWFMMSSIRLLCLCPWPGTCSD